VPIDAWLGMMLDAMAAESDLAQAPPIPIRCRADPSKNTCGLLQMPSASATMGAMRYAFLAVLGAAALIPEDACFAMTPKFTGDLVERRNGGEQAYFRSFLQAGEKP